MDDVKRLAFQTSVVGFGLYLAFLMDSTPETAVRSYEWKQWNDWKTTALKAFGTDGDQVVKNVMDAARAFYINTDVL